ncbi:hypothetical protein [Saccharothrix coeruleofusca]|uniref:Uncharacterized protein n=1 Tax=Saccharothrix coeruleofusca TaxID=33919 RepID=A0A918AIQ7_9PSEU|nr:hypothetical protein [Saccharothrix coeruleofusca]GGP37669.1 hypothetical protein GCM10010185_06290 [Saccharothrix coeruleofusca]
MGGVLVTLAVAVGTACAQMFMKAASRPGLGGRSHGLRRDDLLFWTDWIIAASVALIGSALALSFAGKPVPPLQLVASFLALLLGVTAFPIFLRSFAYAGRAEMEKWGWVVTANLVGIVFLLSAVLLGVRVYEFS